MTRIMKTDFKCDECGGRVIFIVEDEDRFSTYGTLQCMRCGWEEDYVDEKVRDL